MKKNWIYLFLSMAIVAPLTSCSNDDDEPKPNEEQEHDPTSDEDQIEVTGYDALAWLQGSLVVVDENGEVVRRVYGKPLDESRPTVISVPALNYAAAAKTFLGWVAPEKEVSEVDGGFDYYLTDAEGKAQGGVSFRAVEGEAGVIARMTVAPGTDLKQVTEVQFVDAESWPENAATPVYEAGKIYNIDAHVLKWVDILDWDFQPEIASLPFYCVQGNTDGKEGILVWLCPDANDRMQHPRACFYMEIGNRYLPTEAEAKKVLDFYDNNNASWKQMVKEMDAKGYMWSPQSGSGTTGNSEFMFGGEVVWWGMATMMCLDLDEDKGSIDRVVHFSPFSYRYMHIRIVPPVAE